MTLITPNNTAIIMTAFDRPDYLRKTLASYDKLKGFKDYDFYAYIDGPYDERTKKECQKSIEILLAYDHPSKTIDTQAVNQGIGPQIYRSKECAFQKYDYVISCVDDYIVAPYALKALQVGYEALMGQLSTELMFDLYYCSDDIINPEIGKTILHEVVPYQHGAFYVMPKSVWLKISPYLKEFIEKFIEPNVKAGIGRPYKNRPNGKIRKWIADTLGCPLKKLLFDGTASDAIVDVACYKEKVRRFSTKVMHIECFGAVGENCTSGFFEDSCYAKHKLYPYNEKKVLESLQNPVIVDPNWTPQWFK